MMLLQLVQDGRVRLSDPVEKYFPQVNSVQGRFAQAPPITLVQLATMTSGLGREPADLPTLSHTAFELGEGPETVLPKSVLEANLARANSTNGNLDSGYGVGFQLSRRGADVFIGHGGGVAGYSAMAWIHRASRTGVIVLRNAGGERFDLSALTFSALAELAKTSNGS